MQMLLVALSPWLVIFALALGLRLLVWRWHEQYQLGGDEQEYFNQALKLLREHRYEDLRLMRPPLYTGFLAACIYMFDSLVQRLRLIQALMSALTVVPVYLLTRQLFGARWVALLAALLAALNYTLAANATELLTETLFVFGLACLFWLLLLANHPPVQHNEKKARFFTTKIRKHKGIKNKKLRASRLRVLAAKRLAYLGNSPNHLITFSAGLTLGALILLRSVALPLLPLGALWLLVWPRANDERPGSTAKRRRPVVLRPWPAISFVVAAALVVAPWTIRNYLAYGAIILVDTTGAENLWLDNNPSGSTPADPLGREDAKRQLYALGDDRAARQRMATAQGLAAITGQPAWFAQKAWGEARKFFALQYFDDMRARRAIWAPPLEVWLRLLLGDGMWLLLLLGGAAGLWLAPPGKRETEKEPMPFFSFFLFPFPCDPRWLFVPWALYTLLTATLFHVELRYRLPLYPLLLPYAAWTISQIAHCRLRIADRRRRQSTIYNLQSTFAVLTGLALVGMTLLQRPYLSESWMLAQKHIQLKRAERALASGDQGGANAAARAALRLDRESALARVALARAALAGGDQGGALAALDEAIAALQAHPYAHLLRGAILREQGQLPAAEREFAYQKNSLEDLQAWAMQAFAPFAKPPAAIEVGRADLGFVAGFFLPEAGGARWSSAESQLLLAVPGSAGARLELQLNAGRPAGIPSPQVSILINGQALSQLAVANGWRSYSVDVPAARIPADRRLIVTIRSPTFRPRDYDRASPDNRPLGVLVRRVEVISP